VSEPIEARVAAIISLLGKRGVTPPATVLDAGCGTGRYASGLANHGYHVLGVDRSTELVAVAKARVATPGRIKFSVGDLTGLKASSQFRAIICRGVLNDVLTDNDREQISRRFAEVAEPGGALLLDVRDWVRTALRYRVRSSTSRTVDLMDGSHLAFRSDTTLERSAKQMIASETFTFRGAGSTTVEQYATEFRMRCWSASELRNRFEPWFERLEIFPDYIVPPTWTDRLVLIGTRKQSK
jgi:ubiquinone/menaquinone biosynthesis C-methylase UbiE